MERRLLHFRMNGPSENVAVHEKPDNREVVKNDSRLERGPLSMNVGEHLVREAVRISENPEAVHKRISKHFEDVPLHVNAIAEQYGPLLGSAIPTGIVGDHFLQELEAMRATILAGVETGTGAEIEHRYMRAKEKPEGFPSWYGIDFRAIEADKRMIRSIREAHPGNPALAGYLTQMERALNEYARVDPSLPSDRWGIIHRNRGDEQMLGMGRTVGIIVAVVAAAFTGVMALGRKKGFTAPLLYAGVAGLLASPGLRLSLFGSKNEKMLAEVDATVNARSFKENVRTYDIAGNDWRTFAEGVMKSGSETGTFLRELKRHPVDSHRNTETINEYVHSVMRAGEARGQLHQMILDGQFPAFVGTLRSAKSTDTQEVVSEYIGRGAGRFEHLADMSAEEANRLFAQAPKQYLGGNMNMPEYQ